MKQIKQTIKAILRYIDKLFARMGSAVVSRMADKTKRPRPDGTAPKLYIDATYIYSTHINTGIQRVVRNIISHLKTHTEAKGIDLVTVALVNGALLKIEQEELEIFQHRSKITTVLERIRRKVTLYIASFARGEVPYEGDILLMLDSSWHLHVWPSVKYAKQRGASVIGVTYDLIPVTHPQFCDDVMEYYFTNWYRQSLHYFDGYIAISQTVMQNLITYFENENAAIERYGFDYFSLGADFDTRHSDGEAVRESLVELYRNKAPVYLTVSTIEPRKNHRFAYEAFKKLWKSYPEITWLIVGRSGWKTEALQQEMRKDKAYQDRLWILSDLNDAELRYCYRHSKALIFPSVVEGYGLPIIESLKNGLPVLASDTPIHREVGAEMIRYFDLAEPDSLALLIREIEGGILDPKEIKIEKITIPTWDQSARELLEKTITLSNQKKQRE